MGGTRGHIFAYTWNGVSMMSMENLERPQVMYPVLGEVVHCGAQWVQGTWEQWHLQLVHSSKGAVAYHSTVVAEVLWGIVKRLDSPLPQPHGGGWRPSLRHCQQSKIW